jgi:hypothetical protein
VSSDLSEDDIADVSFGKSLFAELTTLLAELSTFLSWDCRALTPPLERSTLPRSLTEVWRSLTFEQYDGLLLPHEVKAKRHARNGERGKWAREDDHHRATLRPSPTAYIIRSG